jgi:hypothetical protein
MNEIDVRLKVMSHVAAGVYRLSGCAEGLNCCTAGSGAAAVGLGLGHGEVVKDEAAMVGGALLDGATAWAFR